jgi:hypothetical protein
MALLVLFDKIIFVGIEKKFDRLGFWGWLMKVHQIIMVAK